MSRKYLILAILSIFLLSCGGSHNDNITIVFTGDVLLDRGVKPVIEKNGVKDLFKGVSHHFNNADFVVINLECPITDTASPVNKKYIFRADAKCADGLKQAGVTHCALANNHTMD
ncbi:MAG: CapA family protein, partial [Bacteroidales bacterium]|nr:CapA family protein [Bacteroidales bacterium]